MNEIDRRVCPRCGGRLRRVHRRPWQRLLSGLYGVARYRCFADGCGASFLVHRPSAKRSIRTAQALWVVLLLAGLAGAALLIYTIQDRPAAEDAAGSDVGAPSN
ncbi:MAG TPA: hypothetical protein PKG80_00725 [Acidobacteriota bacterium]|nr:hypothetical protein [Acidobacteriota bacterium]